MIKRKQTEGKVSSLLGAKSRMQMWEGLIDVRVLQQCVRGLGPGF